VSFLLRVLSPSYLWRHPGKTILAVTAIAIGVATFVSMQSAQRTLASSFSASVDRLAGHADLQITGVGGVPELQETLRALPAVETVQPIIEQVIQPEAAHLGGLLVMAVDLAGDQRMRDYKVEVTESEVDDPLVFLAQADSIALSRDFAARAGLTQGDFLAVRSAGGSRQLVVRGLLSPGFARAYGGNIGVMDIYAAQTMFGRGQRFDRIEVRLRPGVAIDDGIAAVTRAIGTGYVVETPERRGAELQRLADTVVAAFDFITVLALGVGVFLVFNVFAVAVERRRRDLGVLRAIGATPRQVSALFLCEAAILGAAGGLAGAALGILISNRSFGFMGAVLDGTRNLASGAPVTPGPAVIVQGVLVGLVASIVAAWLPSRQAARVQPIDAIATGVFAMTRERTPRWHVWAGILLLGAAYLVGYYAWLPGRWLLPMVMLAGLCGIIVLAGRIARALVNVVAPWLSRVAPAAGRVAADALGQPRRTTTSTAALTVSAAFVLGTAGFLQAVRTSFDGWIANVASADLVVRASAAWESSTIHLPYEVRTTLLQTPGIVAVDAVRSDRIAYRGRTVTLVTVEGRAYVERAHPEFTAGDARAFADRLPAGAACVLSEPFAREFALGLGDVVTLESTSGTVALPVAAIVRGDRPRIVIDRSVFLARWGTDRVDTFYVLLEPGADAGRTREALRAGLEVSMPALISTREEFVEDMRRLIGMAFVVIRATVVVALVVSLLGIALSQLVVAAERARDIGILRALGAARHQISGAVTLEAVTLALVSLLIAVPLGDLFAWLLRAYVSERVAGFHFSRAFPSGTALLLLAGLPVVGVFATWLPARRAAQQTIAAVISND
jgi:putative ABC transport system permease protein